MQQFFFSKTFSKTPGDSSLSEWLSHMDGPIHNIARLNAVIDLLAAGMRERGDVASAQALSHCADALEAEHAELRRVFRALISAS